MSVRLVFALILCTAVGIYGIGDVEVNAKTQVNTNVTDTKNDSKKEAVAPVELENSRAANIINVNGNNNVLNYRAARVRGRSHIASEDTNECCQCGNDICKNSNGIA